MNVLILGATGGTGQLVVAQSLDHSHTVTALVRDPERSKNRKDKLHVRAGDVLDERVLASAMAGQEVVISILGVGNSLKSNALIARSVPVILTVMSNQSVRRLIFVSAYGVGNTRQYVPLFPRMLMSFLLRDIYADKKEGEKHILRSDLDWTIVYPVTLTSGPRTSRYQVGERLTLRGFPKISRADVADFLVKQIGDSTYFRKRVLISS